MEQIIKDFDVPADNVGGIFNDKVTTEIKIYTSTRRDVLCYLVDGVPYVFVYEDQLYPTGT